MERKAGRNVAVLEVSKVKEGDRHPVESPDYPEKLSICKITEKNPIFTNTCSATCSKSALPSIRNPFCLLSVNIQENNV